MAFQKQNTFSKQAPSKNLSTDVGKKDNATEQLTFGVSPDAFAALSANPRAVDLFNASSEAFTWGANTTKGVTSDVSSPPQLQGKDWNFNETELIKNCALEGAFAKNAGVQGRLSVSFTPQQQAAYSNSFGIALAQGLDDWLAGRPQNTVYGAELNYSDLVKPKIMSIYTSAYYVYYVESDALNAGEGGTDQETASNLGRNLLIGVGIAAVLAGGLYWMSKNQKAKANPSDMKLYQINDEEESITLDEFLADNRELDPDDVQKIKSLGVEETFHSGGGAQPEWKIRRVY